MSENLIRVTKLQGMLLLQHSLSAARQTRTLYDYSVINSMAHPEQDPSALEIIKESLSAENELVKTLFEQLHCRDFNYVLREDFEVVGRNSVKPIFADIEDLTHVNVPDLRELAKRAGVEIDDPSERVRSDRPRENNDLGQSR